MFITRSIFSLKICFIESTINTVKPLQLEPPISRKKIELDKIRVKELGRFHCIHYGVKYVGKKTEIMSQNVIVGTALT